MTPQPELPHACPEMAAAIADPRVPLRYLARVREYGLALDDVTIQEIRWCPFCGERLPASLRDALFLRLEALGLEPDDAALPFELRSDAWWRMGGPGDDVSDPAAS